MHLLVLLSLAVRTVPSTTLGPHSLDALQHGAPDLAKTAFGTRTREGRAGGLRKTFRGEGPHHVSAVCALGLENTYGIRHSGGKYTLPPFSSHLPAASFDFEQRRDTDVQVRVLTCHLSDCGCTHDIVQWIISCGVFQIRDYGRMHENKSLCVHAATPLPAHMVTHLRACSILNGFFAHGTP
jgi:hypothetical protein